MASEEYSNKLKKLKTKTKRTKSGPKLGIILVIVILFGVLAIGYMFYDLNNTKKEDAITQLNNAKASGIESINKMYKDIDSPNKEIYINEIKNANSIDEINQILNNAKKDLSLARYKSDTIKSVKNIYGKYSNSLNAKKLINNIESANSKEEINKILSSYNIEEDAKKYYLDDILPTIDDKSVYYITIGKNTKKMTGSELKSYLSKLSLISLKEFKINNIATTSKIAIVVNSAQCGKLPLKGDKLKIFDKGDVNTSIDGEVLSSYVIAPDSISYSESSSTENTIVDGSGDTLSYSSNPKIEYTLEGINSILQATAAQKLNKKQIEQKFGEYGIRLNELSDKTQIFDKELEYVIIMSVSTKDIPTLINIDSKNIYVATVR